MNEFGGGVKIEGSSRWMDGGNGKLIIKNPSGRLYTYDFCLEEVGGHCEGYDN